MIMMKGLILGYGSYLTFQVRAVPSAFNESTGVSLAIYNCALIGMLWAGLVFGIGGGFSPQSSATVEVAFMLYGVMMTLGVIFLPKFRIVYKGMEKSKFKFGVAKSPSLAGVRKSGINTGNFPASAYQPLAGNGSMLVKGSSSADIDAENGINMLELDEQSLTRQRDEYERLAARFVTSQKELETATVKEKLKKEEMTKEQTNMEVLELELADLNTEMEYIIYTFEQNPKLNSDPAMKEWLKTIQKARKAKAKKEATGYM